MDRVIAYAGALTSAKDILNAGRNAMVGLAELSQAVLGPSSAVDGFTCTPTSPASLSVILTAGQVYQLENLEASAISGLTQDTHTILKQGIMLDPVTLAITPPTTVGYSQIYLIEVQYQDDDSTTAVLNYYNASNPALPFYGPPVNGTGSGQAQTTVRRGKVAYQVKAGVAATTGTQVAPSPDAGWIGLFLVTVANGQTTITSGNIAVSTGAPFIPAYLPQVPARVQSGAWVYGVDTGTSNNLVVTLNPIPSALVAGMGIRVKVSNPVTGATVINVNGLGNVPVVRQNGTALQAGDLLVGTVYEMVYDGTSFRVVGYTGAQVPQIAGSTTIYVRTDGNDSNDGTANTSAKALLTPQAAVNMAIQRFVLSGQTCTIQLGIPGTYQQFHVPAFPGSITVQGDPNNQTGYIISGPGGGGWSGVIGVGANVTLNGLTIYNTALSDNWIGALFQCSLSLSNVTFDGSGGGSVAAAVIQAFPGSYVQLTGNLTFKQSASYLWLANGGTFKVLGNTYSFPNAVTFTQVIIAQTCGTFTFNTPVTWSGAANVSGQRYLAQLNGVINTFGAGSTFVPGSTAGSTATGGQYA